MSRALLQLVWDRFPGRGGDLNVMQALAEHANDFGTCVVPYAEIEPVARVSPQTLFRSLRRLRAARWIVTARIPGRGRCLAYQINVAKLKQSCRANYDLDSRQTQRILASRAAARRRSQSGSTTSEASEGDIRQPGELPMVDSAANA